MLNAVVLYMLVNFIRKTIHGILPPWNSVGISQSSSTLENTIGEIFTGHKEFEESAITRFTINSFHGKQQQQQQ